MKRLKVHVTQEDIDEGIAGNFKLCPIAVAVKRQTGAVEARVRFNTLGVEGSACGSFVAPLTLRARRFMRRVDRYLEVEPTTFVFEVI